MLSLTKTWKCDIWPHAVGLRNGEQQVAMRDRPADASLTDTLADLLRSLPPRFAWRDAIEFYLDTADLEFIVQPWQPGILSPHELRSLARTQADDVLPVGANEGSYWQISFEDAQWGQASLVACLQQTCWQQLAALAHQFRLRFNGVVTPFQLLLNQFNHPLPAKVLLVAIGPMRSRVACRREGLWQETFSLALPQRDVAQQLEIIGRLSGMINSPCAVLTTANWRHWKSGDAQ